MRDGDLYENGWLAAVPPCVGFVRWLWRHGQQAEVGNNDLIQTEAHFLNFDSILAINLCSVCEFNGVKSVYGSGLFLLDK